MRYHRGLGVGHLETHRSACNSGHVPSVASCAMDVQLPDLEIPEELGEPSGEAESDGRSSDMCYESDKQEPCLEDSDLDEWEDTKPDDSGDCGNEGMGDEDEFDDVT
jgi:hypothetical protein